MFDIGFLELLVVGVVALLVLGPERLPKAARTAGLWIGKIKRTVSGMQREINAQLEAEELRQKLKEQQQKLDDSLNKVKQDVERYAEPDSKATEDRQPATEQRPSEAGTEGADETPSVDAPSSEAPDDETPHSPTSRLDKALARKASQDSERATTQPQPNDSPSTSGSPSTKDKDATSR